MPNADGALLRRAHPWGELEMARLYDAFPFDGDLSFYLELAEAQGGRVLEVACGTGRVLVPLAAAGHEIVGVDASPAMLALAGEKLEAAGAAAANRVRLVEGDMRDFHLGEEFDLAIVAVKSIAYLTSREDQQRTIAAIAAHLRPGGLLAIDLMHPSPAWLAEPAGSVRQDVVGRLPGRAATVVRTETVVSTDLATQVRMIRSIYDVVPDDGTPSKRIVEWPYRYLFRFEAEHLLERASLRIEALYGGYRREPFVGAASTMLFLARR